ncbi:hypothetical protein M8C21_033219 [Ambrosia artemisiifolia]|uniref:Uncharacterized protein n=1 Tax=Ambrosia artemisiifolia TaxID=4212 RepID=A0AAD5C0N8_AMBAR|nr:hypothetical protein M8C21_033219 [Ambrosia artemisiifolia]
MLAEVKFWEDLLAKFREKFSLILHARSAYGSTKFIRIMHFLTVATGCLDKKSLQLGPDDHLHLEGFASNVFAKADKQDRAGKADLYDKFSFYECGYYDTSLLKIF